uniref:MBD domain-containing protein n=1 Tax=Oryza punctata TaxID=4537 RepID=A0A0E0L2D9_ORYPU
MALEVTLIKCVDAVYSDDSCQLIIIITSLTWKPGFITIYAITCCKCEKWRTIPTKEEFEVIRQNYPVEPWFCSKKRDCSCEHPEDIQYDTSRSWAIDRPNIPKAPPKTERLLIMRNDLSKMDAYYDLPNRKRAKGKPDIDRFLKENPECAPTLPLSSFNFSTPKIIKETVSESAKWVMAKRKRGSSTDSIGMYAVQCCECHKWRKVPTKDEFETIRENFIEEPWHCSKRPDCSCEDAADIEYDSSRIWVLDKPNIPKPPAGTERLVIMRGDLSKMDTYYVMPNGKRVRCTAEVDKFLEANPQYKDRFSVESFSFTTPKIVEETVSHNSVWKSGKAKKQDKINALSNNN